MHLWLVKASALSEYEYTFFFAQIISWKWAISLYFIQPLNIVFFLSINKIYGVRVSIKPIFVGLYLVLLIPQNLAGSSQLEVFCKSRVLKVSEKFSESNFLYNY